MHCDRAVQGRPPERLRWRSVDVHHQRLIVEQSKTDARSPQRFTLPLGA
jgi:hypothetical protein